MITMQHWIEFPKFGWHLPLNTVLFEFSLFGTTFSVRWYGLLIAIGFLLAVMYGMKRAPEFDINPDKMIDTVLVTTVIAFIGARLYYVFFCADLSEYLANPVSILYIWKGGLGIYGAVIFAFVFGSLMCRLCKIDILRMFDLASLGFLIGQTCGRWGNFFNQEAFGGNTTLPWGMTGDMIQSGVNGSGYDLDLPVHPTFLYESLWCLLGFVLLHLLSKKRYQFKGEIFCGYLVWYGFGRFLIESLRTDSLMLGTMKTSQFVAVIAVTLGIVLFFVLRRRAVALPSTLVSAEPTLDIPPETPAEPAPVEKDADTASEAETPDEGVDEANAEIADGEA